MQKVLTKAEEQVMQSLWKLEKAYLKEVIESLPEPKPHNNTVATLLKILMEKGFVANEIHGRNNLYFPLISKEEYSKNSITSLVDNYFNGSFASAVSFMVQKEKLNVSDIELLLSQLKPKS